jgi:hypothetical protein
MQYIIFVFLSIVSLYVHAGNSSAPNAREMYVSCVLAVSMEDSVKKDSRFSTGVCHAAILSLIANREGKGNRNAGQVNDDKNFCLPESLRPEVLMMDAYIQEYERAFGVGDTFTPGDINGGAAFAVSLSKKFPCI